MSPGTRAVIYARISRDPGHDELGVMRQTKACRELCHVQGYDVAEVIVDDDQSAYRGKRRPGYVKACEMLRAREASVLVAWHPDRLTRHPRELEDLIDLLESVGATVHTVQAGEVDLTSASGRMVARVVGAMARHESEHKSARLRAKSAETAAAGRPSGGGPWRSFGWEPDRMTVRESEAAIIREVVARFLDGATMFALLRDLARRGVRTPSGGTWTNTQVRALMTSPRNAGLRVHQGTVIGPAAWPAIIDPDDRRKVLAVLDARPAAQPARRYVLVGLLRCTACGGRMVAQPKKDQRSYNCARHVGGCNGRRCQAEPLEALVVDAVLARLAGAPTSLAPSDDPDVSGPLAAIEGRLSELGEMWAAGEIDRVGWQAARRALEAERAALAATVQRSARRKMATTLPRDPAALRAAWDALVVDERRALLAEVVERVDLGPAARGRNTFDPGRVAVVWRA